MFDTYPNKLYYKDTRKYCLSAINVKYIIMQLLTYQDTLLIC